MKIIAWINMGVERRETVIEIPDAQYEAQKERIREDPNCSLEAWLEEYVFDWLYAQFGWGWSGGEYENNFGFMENALNGGSGSLVTTAISSIPNTRAYRLDLNSEQIRCPCCSQGTLPLSKAPSDVEKTRRH
ncbi:hypothetical protein ACFL5T_00195 [Gemmatimonadota bacterium]